MVLAWCLWLLGAWAVTLSRGDSSGPSVRWMVLSAMAGMMLLWPAFRLSQDYRVQQGYGSAAHDKGPMPIGRLFFDWVSLNFVFQAVIWPLQITAGWRLTQTLLLDGAMASWSLLMALLIAWGMGSARGARRAWAMGLCVLLLFGEPVLISLVVLATQSHHESIVPWHMRVSPIETLWALADSRRLWAPGPWVERVAAAAAAGTLGWLLLALFNARKAGMKN